MHWQQKHEERLHCHVELCLVLHHSIVLVELMIERKYWVKVLSGHVGTTFSFCYCQDVNDCGWIKICEYCLSWFYLAWFPVTVPLL